MLTVFGLVVFAYLLGSVPSGWIVMKLYRGQDLRRVGSGNIGAANVFRAGGPGAFATTLAADGLKGVIPVLAGILLGYGPQEWVLALIGLFLGFHGGKGVATSGGVMLVLAPVAVVLSVVTWAILIRATKIASLSSLAAVGVGFVALLGLHVIGWQAWRPVGWWVIGLGVVLLGLVVVRHRANISRLARGRELKITTPTT